MALAEPEAEPAAAAKAILQFCGQESEKPLLLLGGVYNRKLVTAMDIEVRRRAGVRSSMESIRVERRRRGV